MEKRDIASRLAETRKISKAQAADQLDGVVHSILVKLRKGKRATLPGLGVLKPGNRPEFRCYGALLRRQKALKGGK